MLANFEDWSEIIEMEGFEKFVKQEKHHLFQIFSKGTL